MGYIPDISAYDKEGRLILLVEVKNKTGTSSDWAAKKRRNIIANQPLTETARYFILALPDHFYLWKDSGNNQEIILPEYEIDPSSFLQPYYIKSGYNLDELGHDSFTMVIASWLSELLLVNFSSFPSQYNNPFFVESGLFEAVKGGRLSLEVPV
jgi:hypothetical protein